MSIIQALDYLNKYAHTLSDDENFKEFAQALFSFSEKIKYEKNINDKDIFIEELQKELLKNYKDDEAYKNFFFIQASALALEMESNFYIDMQNYHTNFQKAYELLKEKENLDELDETKEELMSELLQNLDFNENLSLEKDENEQKINSYENALLNESFITPLEDSFKMEEETIKPDELIAFIKDENQNSYPFDRKDTLNNVSFMKDFRKKLNALSTAELKSMVEAMRAKNEALRKELEALKNKKEGLLRELQGEMVANSNLSLTKDELDTLQNKVLDEKEDAKKNDDGLYEKMAHIQSEQEANSESKNTQNFKRKK